MDKIEYLQQVLNSVAKEFGVRIIDFKHNECIMGVRDETIVASVNCSPDVVADMNWQLSSIAYDNKMLRYVVCYFECKELL